MTSTVQRTSFIAGWVLIALGILGFITSPGSMSPSAADAPRILGVFPVDIVLNVLHLTLGVWGLAASQWHYSAREFARISGVIFIVIAIWGIFSPSFVGIFPTGGNNIWLHALIGLPLGYYGFTARDRVSA